MFEISKYFDDDDRFDLEKRVPIRKLQMRCATYFVHFTSKLQIKTEQIDNSQ